MMDWAISIAADRRLLSTNNKEKIRGGGKYRGKWSIECEIYFISLRDSFSRKYGQLYAWKMVLEVVMVL
jgi:hypothetical protein